MNGLRSICCRLFSPRIHRYDCDWKLVPSKILFPLIDARLILDLSSVLNSVLDLVSPLPLPQLLRLWFRILA